MPTAARRHLSSPIPARTAQRPSRTGLVCGTALVAAVLASNGLGTSPAAAVAAPNAVSAAGPAPGTIFVANRGGPRPGYVYDGGGTGKGSVTAYRPGATGDARPELLITAGVDNPGSIAFDPSGDLWVPNSTSNTVVEYSRAELSKASPVPTVTIGDNGQPWADAFDPSGDLWVYNDSGTVVEFTKAQLAKSGSPQPAVTLGNGVSLIAFDSSGDLWEGDGAHVFEWAKAQLTKSGAPAPRVNIFSSSLQSVFQPTFDSSGDLWVTNYPGRTVVEFTKAQLAKSGSLNAKVTISSEPASEGLDYPGDVGFDLTGDLWVPNAGHNAVIEFAKSQLAKSGSQRPAKVIAGTATGLNWPWSVAVEP